MKRYLLFPIIIALALAATGSAAERTRIRDGGAPDEGPLGKARPVDVTTPGKDSVEEMAGRAALVVRAYITDIIAVDEDDEDREGSQRKIRMRKRMDAVLDIQEIYRGGFSGDDIRVRFYRSAVEENPPLLDYSRGEEAVLFLSPTGVPGVFRTVSAHAGKLRYSADLEDRLRALQQDSSTDDSGPEETNEKKKKDGELTINIMPGAKSVKAGEPLFMTVLVMNNTEKYVRIDGTFEPLRCLEIIGPDGGEVSPLRNRAAAAAPYLITLRPNHFVGARIDIAEHFDISKPGIYQFRAVTKPRSMSSSVATQHIRSPLVSIVVE